MKNSVGSTAAISFRAVLAIIALEQLARERSVRVPCHHMERFVRRPRLLSRIRWKKGRRPSFIKAAEPKEGERLYEHFMHEVRALGIAVEKGIFGAHMEVTL